MNPIGWCDTTWNPVVGCTPVSPGCLNCYAATMARRLEAMGRPEYVGLTVRKGGRAVFSGAVRCLPNRLTAPLRWRKPRRVFVNSMNDLFHEGVPFEFVDRVFVIMALCPQHQFQVLTKRPERMAEYLDVDRDGALTSVRLGVALRELVGRTPNWPDGGIVEQAVDRFDRGGGVLPNVWLGTSVEDQARADERVPHLLRCPAAVRFLSCEPLLGPVALKRHMAAAAYRILQHSHPCDESRVPDHLRYHGPPSPDWVIVGGESGPKARPCDVEWIRSIVVQCREAEVPCYVKQLGARTVDGRLRSRSGADPAEWPADLRVRQWPGGAP